MPLNIPNLDDRTYTDLVDEAVGILPLYAPSWTNHNASDPGITLIELFAYFTEMFIYRLNRVTKDTKIRFLQLLYGSKLNAKAKFGQAPVEEIDEELRRAVVNLRRRRRAVTCDDYEYLAREATVSRAEEERVLRARSFVGRDLRPINGTFRDQSAPGHVSVVVLPASDLEPDRLDDLLKEVRDFLEPQRLLTTRLHVVKPLYLWAAVGATIHPRPETSQAILSEMPRKAVEKLNQFFSPWPGGGPDAQGWPFGRAFYVSEVYEALEQVEGVNYVEDVRVARISGEPGDDESAIGIYVERDRRSPWAPMIGRASRLGAEAEIGADRLVRDAVGRLTAISLRPYELIRIASRTEDISISGSLDNSTATPTIEQ